jgi:hypothetical protein
MVQLSDLEWKLSYYNLSVPKTYSFYTHVRLDNKDGERLAAQLERWSKDTQWTRLTITRESSEKEFFTDGKFYLMGGQEMPEYFFSIRCRNDEAAVQFRLTFGNKVELVFTESESIHPAIVP